VSRAGARVRILGIESSCDETACAVVEDGKRVLSSVIASQHDLHAEYAGVVPEIASRAHVERMIPVLRRALDQAECALDSVDAIAVGHRPGLIGSLVVGLAAGKALAWTLGVPLVGVDHVHAHLYAGLLETDPPPAFPAIGLVVSGGHTAIYKMASPIDIERLGATIDDAIGEAYDKAATILGLGYPGGPALDALAQDRGDDRAVDLPISRLGPGSLDFSFSGLKTALLYHVRGTPGPGGAFPRPCEALTDRQRRDCAASFQRAACEAVVLKLGRAITTLRAQGCEPRSMLVGGGVSANSRLRAELVRLCSRQGLDLRLPSLGYCLDNAAMIAGLAFPMLAAGRHSGLDLRAVPTTAC